MKDVLAIDPGQKGALVFMSKTKFFVYPMPLDSEGHPSFVGVMRILKMFPDAHVFLEKAVSFGMGVTGAFNYGRGFAMVECAVKLCRNELTLVPPRTWAEIMHRGLDPNLKPKVKSLMAFEKSFNHFRKELVQNKNGKLHDGMVDAVLIAGYGRIVLSSSEVPLGTHLGFTCTGKIRKI